MVTMDWVVSRFRLKAPPGISSSCISPLTSLGQRSRASWASQPQESATLSPQPGGKPRKFIRTCGGIGGGGNRQIFNHSHVIQMTHSAPEILPGLFLLECSVSTFLCFHLLHNTVHNLPFLSNARVQVPVKNTQWHELSFYCTELALF